MTRQTTRRPDARLRRIVSVLALVLAGPALHPLGAQSTVPTGTNAAREVDARLPRGEGGLCGDVGFTDGLPPNFYSEPVADSWDGAVGLTFDGLGRLYVWEKRGIVWIVENGVKLAQPLIDITDEVGDWESHGLKGFALDPDFHSNGFVYLLYAVDRHHLDHYGTPSYDPEANDYYTNSISRVTRYTATAMSGRHVVDEGTRTVLIGQALEDGMSICGFHACGDLVFLHDGSLALSYGDNDAEGHATPCVDEGVWQPKEGVGSLRAQLVDSLNGKILRIDPATGAGMPDNPFYDPGSPFAPRSRVWAMGFRNPFRLALMPPGGAGGVSAPHAHRPGVPAHGHGGRAALGAGDPGKLLVGDVGSGYWEELSIVSGGDNCGWPLFEGLRTDPDLWANPTENLDAPNPLFGVGGCTQAFFHFQDLIAEDSLNAVSWPNPCNPGQEVPAGIPTFEHTRPILTWQHFTGPAAVPTYDGGGEAAWVELGQPTSPVAGAPFPGNSSIGGTWYDGTSFPPEYQDTYFHADFGAQWIYNLRFQGEELVAAEPFALNIGPVVDMAVDPISGDLYYIRFIPSAEDTVSRIGYSVENLPPVPVIHRSDPAGYSPWSVQFSALSSTDPEGETLTYEWDFGDGSLPVRLPEVNHVFPSRDASYDGAITLKLHELVPPQSMGSGSLDPETMRDDVWPLTGTFQAPLQFDTLHFDPETFLPDKGPEDWFGYVYGEPKLFTEVFFREGTRWEPDTGGWFETPPTVQVMGPGGVWQDVGNLAFEPAYPTILEPFGSWDFLDFHVSFEPVVGYGIRIHGEPGGVFDFVSVAELRVMAWDPSVTEPRNYEVVLKVTDEFGNQSCTSETVSVNNTPPTVQITSPIDGAPVDVQGPPVTLPFAAMIGDAEHGIETLQCQWRTTLVHDNHVHPGPPDTQCATQGTFVNHALDPGDIVYYEIELTVTDPLGLQTTDKAHLFFRHDANFNGIDDATDIAMGTSLDTNGNGVPDECETDCNGNGIHDLFDIVLGYSADADTNGIPDECGGAGAPGESPAERLPTLRVDACPYFPEVPADNALRIFSASTSTLGGARIER